MDVYRQAADVVQKVREGQGTAKSLCLEKHMQKKKQTFAVVCETLRRFDGLNKILEKAQFFEFYPLVDRYLAMVLAYDTCFGMGVRTKQHEAAIAILDSAAYLHAAKTEVVQEDPSLLKKYAPEPFEEDDQQTGAARRRRDPARLPTYVRVNTLAANITTEGALEYFKKRERGADDDDPNFNPSVKRDTHIPDLLVLPPATDLHKSKLIRNGALIVQDKASCIPPCVLLGAVPVVAPEGSAFGPPMRRIVDACAAPGNKTTQLAALGLTNAGRDGVSIVACEMDARRAATLKDRVNFLHASEHIKIVEGDFMELENKHRSRAEGVLVDPSCSASGMVKRIDVVTAANETGNEEQQERRVENLARMQEKLLVNALTCYPRARRVVYSTCSIHERENEEVVRRALATEGVAAQWALANIMPDTWTTRGLPTTVSAAPAAAKEEGEEVEETTAAASAAAMPVPTEFCVRCDPEKDHTSGFFVACFDRVGPPPASS